MIKKVALVAFICFIVGIIGTLIYGDGVFANGSKVEVDEDSHVEGEKISQIRMKVDVGDISVTASKDEDIHVYLKGEYNKSARNNFRFDVEQNGDELVITVDRKQEFGFSITSLFNFNNSGKIDLKVELPVKQYEYMRVTTNVGDLYVDQVASSDFIVESNVGDVTIDELTTDVATVDLNVGDTIIRNATGKVEVNANTGGIELSFAEMTDDVKVKSNVGDINISFLTRPENIVFDLKTDVGDISIDAFEGISQQPGKYYYVELGEGPAPRLEATTNVGDLTVTGN